MKNKRKEAFVDDKLRSQCQSMKLFHESGLCHAPPSALLYGVRKRVSFPRFCVQLTSVHNSSRLFPRLVIVFFTFLSNSTQVPMRFSENFIPRSRRPSQLLSEPRPEAHREINSPWRHKHSRNGASVAKSMRTSTPRA